VTRCAHSLLSAAQSHFFTRDENLNWRNIPITVRREKALVHSGKKTRPGNWIAPPGSNRSGGGGNKAVEASGVEGRIGDSASLQVVTRVNAEQASKLVMQEPTQSVMWGRPTTMEQS
jgi:hypothetical protein